MSRVLVWRIIGGILFAAGMFLFILPELGKSVTIGLIIAFIGSSVAVKAS